MSIDIQEQKSLVPNYTNLSPTDNAIKPISHIALILNRKFEEKNSIQKNFEPKNIEKNMTSRSNDSTTKPVSHIALILNKKIEETNSISSSFERKNDEDKKPIDLQNHKLVASQSFDASKTESSVKPVSVISLLLNGKTEKTNSININSNFESKNFRQKSSCKRAIEENAEKLDKFIKRKKQEEIVHSDYLNAAKKDFKKEINQYSKQIDQESDSVSFNLIKSESQDSGIRNSFEDSNYDRNKAKFEYENKVEETKKLNQQMIIKTYNLRKKQNNSAVANDLTTFETDKKIAVKNKIFKEEAIKKLDLQRLNENVQFEPHLCKTECVSRWEKNIKQLSKQQNILLIPIHCGWKRQICIRATDNKTIIIKKNIHYTSPCGLRLRNILEIDNFLLLTNSDLTIDMFSYDIAVEIDRVFQTSLKHLKVADISKGKDNLPISCVNCIDSSKPESFQYSSVRLPVEGIPLDTDPSLLDCCDCTDGCRNHLKCACWRKTFEATLITNKLKTNIGYNYRKLYEMVSTGIFECNSKCKCDKRCTNRVVQNGITLRLQLFKVSGKKGWGVRCLDDVAKGTFICSYSGHVITEKHAFKRKTDEYFAELDFIKCLKRENSEKSFVDKKKKSIIKKKLNNEDEFKNSSIQNNPQASRISSTDALSVINSNRFFTNPSNRFYFKNFFKETEIFIVDAKLCANIGRFFNHSCNPNIFAQNVFIDTYDLRFPWIALFASKNIRAGTELVWDYNYQPKSVKGRVLYCQCGSRSCRGRLL